MHVSMQKMQILFPDPLMKALRKLSQIEDRPVSELVRRAVDRDLEQRAGMLGRSEGKTAAPAFPTFNGGRMLAKASEMKSLLYDDEA